MVLPLMAALIHTPWWCLRARFSPHSCQDVLGFAFWIAAALSWLGWDDPSSCSSCARHDECLSHSAGHVQLFGSYACSDRRPLFSRVICLLLLRFWVPHMLQMSIFCQTDGLPAFSPMRGKLTSLLCGLFPWLCRSFLVWHNLIWLFFLLYSRVSTYSKPPPPVLVLCSVSSVFSSRSCFVLFCFVLFLASDLIFKSLTHFKLIFEYGTWQRPSFTLLSWISSLLSTLAEEAAFPKVYFLTPLLSASWPWMSGLVLLFLACPVGVRVRFHVSTLLSWLLGPCPMSWSQVFGSL